MKSLIELPDEQFDNIKNCKRDYGVMINSMIYAIKHGAIITDNAQLFCFNCGITEMQPLYGQKYCRYCGAKLEDKENENENSLKEQTDGNGD